MSQPKAGSTKSASIYKQNNPAETFRDYGQSMDQNSLIDQLFSRHEAQSAGQEKKQPRSQRQEFSVFNYQSYYEKEIVKKQIKELTEQIKKEIEMIKKSGSSFLSEVQDIEKLTIDSLPEKPGIYHIRFLEIVLRVLKTLREKISESRTWLSAMTSKRKKRGSLFASLSKKKGTQYSLSQEISNARSVQ